MTFFPRSPKIKPRKSRNRILIPTILFACVSVTTNAHSQQSSGGKQMQLSKVEVAGLHRFTQEQVLEASGLRIGQNISVDMLDEAAKRLSDSGLFQKLSYRLHSADGKAVVTFEVEEVTGEVPVVFDNFAWFSEEELSNAVRHELPTFNGTAPESGGTTEIITRALQRLLDERKIPGRVEYTPSADPSGGHAKHIFSVKGMSIPICTLQFPGSADVPEGELVKNSKPLFGSDYSREFVASFTEENLIPLYRQRGHLRAAFRMPAAKPDDSSNCKGGVGVTVPVEEGLIYSWDRAEWSGNTTLPAQELDRALGMKAGELANGLKIDAGFKSVREAYGKKGYIMVRLSSKPSFDDAARRVVYNFAVTEGPQFRMGELTINGVAEGDARSLKEKWMLKPGDVYDASYLDGFMKNALRGFMMRMGPGAGNIHTEIKPDRQNQKVDVVISFKK